MRRLRYYLGFVLMMVTSFVLAQLKDPVKFKMKINDLGNNQYEVVLDAVLDQGWHIYSKDLPSDSGIPTSIKITGDNVENIGNLLEIGKKHDEFSEAFQTRIVFYSDKVQFKQKIKLKKEAPTNVSAEITYQTCNDKVCLAPNTLEFSNKIEFNKGDSSQNVKHDNSQSVEATSNKQVEQKLDDKVIENLKIRTIDYLHPLQNCGEPKKEDRSNMWWILFLGFTGGLIALVTPCVFPMIPLTVSFFIKGSKNKVKGRKDAIIYGLFVFLIFVLLSVPFHIIDGISGNIFNQISTNVWLNLFFFIIFVVFALSFFGFYEITLPSWVANKSSKAEEAGGLIGMFFMALTLVIVSFSCTGPILGSLLGSAITGDSNVPTLLTFALAGFGLAWAIVFGVLALFPQMLKSIPKSGGWLNTVKVVLGFVEIALALKFLSKADLVSKTFLLKREIFVLIWIVIVIGLALYLFGKIRFPHDDKNPKISKGRKGLAILSILFAFYLVIGLFPSKSNRLQLLSGILPPVNVSFFHYNQEDLKVERDYFKAVELAKKLNKPILIDFTGYGCENCRRMEENVWSQPDISQILHNDVLIVSLYVDDKEELPENEQIIIDLGEGQKKKIKTIGDKWSFFQRVNFNNNSQPHYVLLTPNEKVINTPVSGYMSKEDFKSFLDCGIKWFNEKH